MNGKVVPLHVAKELENAEYYVNDRLMEKSQVKSLVIIVKTRGPKQRKNALKKYARQCGYQAHGERYAEL